MPRQLVFCLSSILALTANLAGQEQDPVLFADFEGKTYGPWQVDGEAFGPGPAQGTLPNQMAVSGFQGKGLVNSFFQGDGTTGRLTSPPFKVKRAYVTFLIGGGGYPDKTCIQLLLDGKVVRTATGPNTRPGGSEALSLHYWDVQELAGQTVRIRIVDQATGGWGHINIDHIVLTDTKPDIPLPIPQQEKTIKLTQKYLLFPIQTGAKKSRVNLQIEDGPLRAFDTELATSEENIDFWAFMDISSFEGRTATLEVQGATKQGFGLLTQGGTLPDADQRYTEALRPQFHFSQQVGWNNDPNGLVYYDGEWHLFFQHNPYGWSWANMHWGHAISKDLVHWRQLPIALYNPRHGDWAFSGSAVVDRNNTAGWQTGDDKVIVLGWTSTGRGECIAHSNDRGRSFTEYSGNPVVKHRGRDPKLLWYAPGQHWVMAVYDESKERGQAIAFYTSSNLKSWTLQSKLPGYYECPELVELPVDGDVNNTRWVIFAADAQYAIGQFDGKTFTPEHQGKHRLHHGAYYASQCFNHAPDGRVIQIGWARIGMPGMPFNQTFTFPHRLTLRTTTEGIRLFAEPVKEIRKLYQKQHTAPKQRLTEAGVSLPVAGTLLDIRARVELGDAQRIGLRFGKEQLVYDIQAQKLDGIPLAPLEGKLHIRVLVDRPMLEIIGNQGRIYLTRPRKQPGPEAVGSIQAFAQGGSATLTQLEVHELSSIWPK